MYWVLAKITPEIATQWLEGNAGNRTMRPWWVACIAAAMRNGEWLPTHQGIAFTESGRLLDGQHRLSAIAISGTTQEMWVCYGVPDAAFKTIDCGVKRSIGDLTGLSAKTAEVCRRAAQINFGDAQVSAATVLQVYNSGLGEVCDELLEYCSSTKKTLSSAPVRLAACLKIMDGVPKSYVFDVYKNLVNDRYEALPPVALAFIRQVNSNILGKADAIHILMRALKVFDLKTRDSSTIRISNDDNPATREYVKQIIRRGIETRIALEKLNKAA